MLNREQKINKLIIYPSAAVLPNPRSNNLEKHLIDVGQTERRFGDKLQTVPVPSLSNTT